MTPAIFTCLRSQFPSVVSGTISSRGLERSTGNCCKSRSTWVSWLGGWAWLCSTQRRGGRGGGWFSFLQGPLKVSDGGLEESKGSGDLCELALREELHQGEISHCGPVTPLTPIQLAWAKLTNGFQIHYQINRRVQMWSKKHFNVADYDRNWYVYLP